MHIEVPFKDSGSTTPPLLVGTCGFVAPSSLSSPLTPFLPVMSSFVGAATDRFLLDAVLRFRFCDEERAIPSAVDSREWGFAARSKRLAGSGAWRI